VHEDVVLDYTFAGEDDVFGAEDGGAAGDFVAGFLGVVRLDGLRGMGWLLTVSIYSPRREILLPVSWWWLLGWKGWREKGGYLQSRYIRRVRWV
jgi:hypothetical protein